MSEDVSGLWAERMERSRAETRAAFEERALMYAHIYRAFADEIGPERTTEVMKRAIYKRGLEKAHKYRDAAQAGDLAEVGRIFCDGSPADGTLFGPSVKELRDDAIVLRMSGCPLVEVWEGVGMEQDDVDRLCEIAAAVDEGTFEGAGLELTFLERAGAAECECCLLELKLPG